MKKLRAQNLWKVARRAAVACALYGNIAPAQVPPAAIADAGAAGSDTIPDSVASQFVETCSGCHTIGGGVSRGPDLAGVAAWPAPQLTLSVKSMERKVGPMSAEQVESLVTMLKDSTVQQRIASAKAKLVQVSAQPRPPADSLLGGAIFFGQVALQGGGMPCNSCHRYHGEGGDFGPELSRFAEHSELESLAGTIARASFPVMRSAYASHPITQQEARHLAAFMQQAKSERRVAPTSTTTIWGVGAGLGVFAITAALIFARPKGVRARLIQRATKR